MRISLSMYQGMKTALWLSISMITMAYAGPAQLNSKYPMGIPPAVKPDAWVAQPWTASDAPFLQIEENVRKQIRAGSSPQAILVAERKNAQEHPLDFAAQFRWLFATTQASGGSDNIEYRAVEAVARQDPGNIRAVARIRFAAGVLLDQNRSHPDLDRVGERLLQTDPRDRWVRGHLIYDLSNSPASLPKAEVMAQAFIVQEPNDAEAHSVLASVYQNLWAVSRHRRIYAEKTIAEYKEFLRLAPPDDPFRHDAEYLVKGFTKRLSSSIP